MHEVLIAGGAGFIGFHLGRSLAREGHRVVLADDFSRGVADRDLDELAAGENVELVRADLLDPKAVAALGDGFDYIFHLAAIVGVRHVLERPYDVLDKNVALLARMIEHGRRQKRLRRFVFASTSEVYAGTLAQGGLPFPTPEDTPLTVSDLAEPRSSYMLSKIYGEAMCLHSGLPVTVVRPHNFYGPRMGLSHVIPELLEKAHELPPNGELEVFSVEHRRTFCFIDDAIRMMWDVARAPASLGMTLNIGIESPEVSIGDVAAAVIDVVGKPLTIRARPATPGSPRRRCPSLASVRAITGPVEGVTLPEGVRRTYDWYRPHVFEGQEVSAT